MDGSLSPQVQFLREQRSDGRKFNPDVAQGYLIFPAQKDERHQEQLHTPGQG